MTSTADDVRDVALRVRGPDELIHAVPYLLGFHPHDSLVAVGLRRGSLVVTMRIDLSELQSPDVLPQILSAMSEGGARSIIGVVYTQQRPDPGCAAELPRSDLVEALTSAAAAAGIGLDEILLVSGGRWWSYLCRLPECCPPEGRPVSPEGSPIPAAATYAGLVALPDRAALERSFDPEPGRDRLLGRLRAGERSATGAILAGRGDRHDRAIKRALFAKAREHDEMLLPELDENQVVRFGAALRSAGVRDAVLRACDARRVDGRPLWQALARRLPQPYDAAPLLLFGWASWRRGNGALARTTAERALASDPDCSAAELLLTMLSRGMDPRRTPRLRPPRPA
jgi:hypothetical protein